MTSILRGIHTGRTRDPSFTRSTCQFTLWQVIRQGCIRRGVCEATSCLLPGISGKFLGGLVVVLLMYCIGFGYTIRKNGTTYISKRTSTSSDSSSTDTSRTSRTIGNQRLVSVYLSWATTNHASSNDQSKHIRHQTSSIRPSTSTTRPNPSNPRSPKSNPPKPTTLPVPGPTLQPPASHSPTPSQSTLSSAASQKQRSTCPRQTTTTWTSTWSSEN